MWVTDMGWIMGPLEVVGAGALGATLVIGEGAPDYPGPDRLWDMVERHRISVLGVSPTLIRALQRARRRAGHPPRPLVAARCSASTGEPWNPDPYRWLHEVAGEGRAPIINLSGGTEVGACFLSPMPVMPLKECTLGAPALGMAMDVVGPDGEHLPPGAVGELVCRKPWPSMTRGVWGDPERYLQAYWSRWPGVWAHGDWASVDEDGCWYLHGRSDDTLNIAGQAHRAGRVRVGRRRPRRRRRGVRGGDARPGQGRGGVALLRAAARVRARRRAARRGARRGHRRARQGVRARPDRLRDGASRRRARPRSCAAPCGRRRSATTSATPRRSRTRRCSRR